MIKNYFLIMLMLLSLTSVNGQKKHTDFVKSKEKKYKDAMPVSVNKEIDKLMSLELANKGGLAIGKVDMTGFCPTGDVTKTDLARLKRSFKSLTPPRTNFKNNLGLIRRNIDVLDMAYEMSGDIWFLDKMIECCDYMVDAQNGPGKYKCITGEYEYYWPTGFTFKDGEVFSNTALFSNGVIVGRLARVAKRILSDKKLADTKAGISDKFNFGKTYGERALTYMDRGTKTLDYLVKYCYDSETGLMIYPEAYKYSNRPDFVGIAPAWNRYFMMGVGFSNVASVMKMLDGDEAKIKLYDGITQKMVNEFFSTIKTVNVHGMKAYWWPYNYYFSPDRAEDAGHAWFDIDLLMHFYRSQKYGISNKMMMPLANTYMEVMYQGKGRLSGNVGGSGKVKTMPGGIGWLQLLEFRPEIYEIMVTHHMSHQKLNGRDFGELLYAKHFFSQMHPSYKWKDLIDPLDLKYKKRSKSKRLGKKEKRTKK